MDDGVPPGHRDPAAAIPASQARSWSKGYQHKTKIDGNEFYAGSGVSVCLPGPYKREKVIEPTVWSWEHASAR